MLRVFISTSVMHVLASKGTIMSLTHNKVFNPDTFSDVLLCLGLHQSYAEVTVCWYLQSAGQSKYSQTIFTQSLSTRHCHLTLNALQFESLNALALFSLRQTEKHSSHLASVVFAHNTQVWGQVPLYKSLTQWEHAQRCAGRSEPAPPAPPPLPSGFKVKPKRGLRQAVQV